MDVKIENDVDEQIEVCIEPIGEGEIVKHLSCSNLVLNTKDNEGELFIKISRNDASKNLVVALWDNFSSFEKFEFDDDGV